MNAGVHGVSTTAVATTASCASESRRCERVLASRSMRSLSAWVAHRPTPPSHRRKSRERIDWYDQMLLFGQPGRCRRMQRVGRSGLATAANRAS
jgi:hypothetical protein